MTLREAYTLLGIPTGSLTTSDLDRPLVDPNECRVIETDLVPWPFVEACGADAPRRGYTLALADGHLPKTWVDTEIIFAHDRHVLGLTVLVCSQDGQPHPFHSALLQGRTEQEGCAAVLQDARQTWAWLTLLKQRLNAGGGVAAGGGL